MSSATTFDPLVPPAPKHASGALQIAAATTDGFKLAEFLNARNVPGVYFRAAAWAPLA